MEFCSCCHAVMMVKTADLWKPWAARCHLYVLPYHLWGDLAKRWCCVVGPSENLRASAFNARTSPTLICFCNAIVAPCNGRFPAARAFFRPVSVFIFLLEDRNRLDRL